MGNFVGKAGRAVGFGLLFFGLRLVQLRSGFDPDTGLALPSAAGTALAVCLAAAAAGELLLSLGRSGEKLPFRRRFAPAERVKALLAMGGMLLAAGGAAMAACAATGGGIAVGAAGALGVAAGAGTLVFTQQIGHRVELSVMPLLPSMFFGVFLVLAEYLPEADDPVLARYYIPVLAAAMAAYAFSQLAGCVQGEGSPRWFTPFAELAAALCVAAAADGLGPFSTGLRGISRVLMYAGCALTMLAFLALQRREDELPPEEEKPAEGETAEMEMLEGSEEA